MSLKGQTKLPIFAGTIVGTTVITIFALHYAIDKIAAKAPPLVAEANMPANPGQKLSLDDEIDSPNGIKAPPGLLPPNPDGFNQKDRARPNNNDPTRRFGRGKEQDSVKMPAPRMPPNQNGADPSRNGGAPPEQQYYPAQGGYPQGYPPPLSEYDQQIMEEEMERRRQMFENMPDDQMPPGYFPPGMEEEFYYPPEDFEDMPNDFYNGYDYDYEAKNNNPKNELIKTTELEDLAKNIPDEEFDEYFFDDSED